MRSTWAVSVKVLFLMIRNVALSATGPLQLAHSIQYYQRAVEYSYSHCMLKTLVVIHVHVPLLSTELCNTYPRTRLVTMLQTRA